MQSTPAKTSTGLPLPAAAQQPSSLDPQHRSFTAPTQPQPLSPNERSSEHLAANADAKIRNSSISSADSGYVTSPSIYAPVEPSSASYATPGRSRMSPTMSIPITSPVVLPTASNARQSLSPSFHVPHFTDDFISPVQAQSPASPPHRRPGPFGPEPGRSSPQPRYPLPPPTCRRACAPCRRKKVGCDLRYPTADYPPPCQRCQSDGERCFFPSNPTNQESGSTTPSLNPPATPSSVPLSGITLQQQQQVPSIRDRACPHCSLIFLTDADLRNHLRTQCAEKHYVCQTCSARFRRLNDLDRHKRIHTGERPHWCDICGRRFSRGTTLTRHRQGLEGCAGRRADLGRRRTSTAYNGTPGEENMGESESASASATPPVLSHHDSNGISHPSDVATAAQRTYGQRHAQAALAVVDSPVRTISSAIDGGDDTEHAYQAQGKTYPSASDKPFNRDVSHDIPRSPFIQGEDLRPNSTPLQAQSARLTTHSSMND